MNNIKKIMLDKNMSFTELQIKTSISKSTLSPLVNSDEIPKKTKLDTLERIANALETSVDKLLSTHIKLSDFTIEANKIEDKQKDYFLKFSYKNYFFHGLLEYDQEFDEKRKKLISENFDLYLNLNKNTNMPDNIFLNILAFSSKNEIREFSENVLYKTEVTLLKSGTFSLILSASTNNFLEVNSFFMGMYNKEKNQYTLGRYSSDDVLRLSMPN